MNHRFEALHEAYSHRPVEVTIPSTQAKMYYAQSVFTRDKMHEYISENILDELFDAIDEGRPLSRDIANSVAIGMKCWAQDQGATHYTHWFQPLTGGTAEKHDTFIDFDRGGKMIDDFAGAELYQQEPDASSFPSGGLRNTFEARGYTAWDPTSPVFIVGDRLCIPSVFVAYTGEALDYKTPLLRSIDSLNKAALEVCKFFDKTVRSVHVNLGWEQEYFLIDEALYNARPDLVLTGRTLMGHPSAKSQQLDDHYFGNIPERVIRFMSDLEVEALKLGIPVKTRHNEVAPNQFELAPIYEEVNLASDHNLLLMTIMKKVARRHHFRVLLHEKPFAGINGSGKHCNWSLATDTGINLLAPGKNPYQNLQFVTFLVNVLAAVKTHNGLIKASIASATNAHRLGANEAPPAIISVFLGKQLSQVLQSLVNASAEKAIIINAKKEVKLGAVTVPEILLDNTDRNRTSPFAFTGNRFEFRAVGASANCGAPMTVLNAAVAEQLTNFAAEINDLIQNGTPKEKAIFLVLQKTIRYCQPILFEGNGYSEEWIQEAAKRGLDTQTAVPLILDQYLNPDTVQLFERTGVLNQKELTSHCEVMWANYSGKIQIEAQLLTDLTRNHVLPAANQYLNNLLEHHEHKRGIFDHTIHTIIQHLTEIQDAQSKMQNYTFTDQQTLPTNKKGTRSPILLEDTLTPATAPTSIDNRPSGTLPSARQQAIAYHDRVLPEMQRIRLHIDQLELIVDDELWTLPKYRELLFIH